MSQEPEAKRIRLTVSSPAQRADGMETGPDGAEEHDLASAPGKEREREPVVNSGEVANISQGMDEERRGG